MVLLKPKSGPPTTRLKPIPKSIKDEVQFIITKAQDKARDMLISDATHCALGGGSRSGKTFLLVRQVLLRAMLYPESRHVIFRFRFNALKASVILDTLPKVLKLCFPDLPSADSMMDKSDWYLKLPNGSEIWFGGLDDKERTEKILGMEFATIYFNECSHIPWLSVSLAHTRLAQKIDGLRNKCFYDFNPPSKKHWTYIFFIEKKDPEDRKPLVDEFDVGFYLINPMDNVENLNPKYIQMLERMSERQRNRFLYGRFADDDEGALWTDEILASNRVLGHQGTLPDFVRIVVAVDPSGSRGPEDTRSDEIGIVVVGLGTDGHGYLIEDLSGRYRPEEWGRIAAEAYERHSADRIVGEVNFGGDMVRATIQAHDENLPYSEVHASRGKVVRAEPISSLYEKGKVHHIGYFPEIEEQLLAMLQSGYVGLKSPDRADALIWALTELFPRMTRKEETSEQRHTHVNTMPRSASARRSGRTFSRRTRR